jgi:sRNA-binding protein
VNDMRPIRKPAGRTALDERAAALLARLIREYPTAFGSPVPLAVGILDEIVDATGADPGTADRALYQITKQKEYILAVRNGEPRRNLDGSMAGAVDQRHRLFAGKVLIEMGRKK